MAGHDPEVVKVRGLGIGPRFMHLMTEGRKEVEELTGQRAVPVLVTDEGEVISDSHRIVEWAEANPAHRSAAAGAASTAGSHSRRRRARLAQAQMCRRLFADVERML